MRAEPRRGDDLDPTQDLTKVYSRRKHDHVLFSRLLGWTMRTPRGLL